jgi:hypothetical protein
LWLSPGGLETASILWIVAGMSAQQLLAQLASLPRPERARAARRVLETLCPANKLVERLMRRIENPDIPEDVWLGVEEAEDGKLIEMDDSLTELDRT